MGALLFLPFFLLFLGIGGYIGEKILNKILK